MTNSAASSKLFEQRRAGVLLHPTSLPGPGDTGTIGNDALKFIDLLRESGFTVWQTLPLGPVDKFRSPYSLSSAFAGDIRLIDLAMLAESPELPVGLPFESLHREPAVLYEAFIGNASSEQAYEFESFMQRQRHWLLPFALFEHYTNEFDGRVWWKWPSKYALCERKLIFEEFADDEDSFRALAFRQFLFDLQWSIVKRYANERGISMFGDLPFYVDRNSADVWWRRDLFALDDHGEPLAVAGVPPDYFSQEGQLWGNPLYDWKSMRADGFQWWRRRLRFQLERFDLLRIDHFRALESYWSVPAHAESAREGEWLPGYGDELLQTVSADGKLPLVAEDLGIITAEVRDLRDRHGLPGMAVMQFGFDGSPDNPHLPYNVREYSVLYTGTHDNNTLVGWYSDLDEGTRGYIAHALHTDLAELPQCIVRMALESRANLVIIPFQDLLGLGSEARMNTPGISEGNWRWRFAWEQIDGALAPGMRELIGETGRQGGRPDGDGSQ
jgi:4-alpha-glucanotransferase